MGPQMGAEALRPIFVPPADGPDSNPWASLHTQWPGGREPGDPIYNQWLAPSGPMLASWADMHALEQRRLAELLDLVGPAVLVTHSAGGPGTFLAADTRPDRVAALIAIETVGPPFAKRPEIGLDLAWGLASAPLTYDPPATDPSELQDGTPRRLPNLSRFPIAVVTAEASMFRLFDRDLVAVVVGAGCDVELVQLADHGVHGNSHGMMLERNHAEVLAVLTRWVDGKLAR
jgi:pimeloyl-ACP methyl ester carboxylesterase